MLIMQYKDGFVPTGTTFTDNFNDNSRGLEWRYLKGRPAGGDIFERNGRVEFEIIPVNSTLNYQFLNFDANGDFTIDVDCDISGVTASSNDFRIYATSVVTIGSYSYGAYFGHIGPPNNYSFVFSSNDPVGSQGVYNTGISSATLRLQRIGTTLTYSYNAGSGFVQVRDARTVTTDPAVSINIGARNQDAGFPPPSTQIVIFDNYSITASGGFTAA